MGIPFAIKETGLVAGVFLVILSAILTGEDFDVSTQSFRSLALSVSVSIFDWLVIIFSAVVF